MPDASGQLDGNGQEEVRVMIETTTLPGVYVLTPRLHEDHRGHFLEAWSQAGFESATGVSPMFVQDNQSRSRQSVLRGLHYQLEPYAQGKLVRVVRGAVFDVAVDIRKSSDTFGRWFGIELSEVNHRQLWIPPGFAHGFLTLIDNTDLVYKTTSYYSPEHDRSVHWNDPRLEIEWPLQGEPIVSEKDAEAPCLTDAEVFE